MPHGIGSSPRYQPKGTFMTTHTIPLIILTLTVEVRHRSTP
jgi:hypothetical protein